MDDIKKGVAEGFEKIDTAGRLAEVKRLVEEGANLAKAIEPHMETTASAFTEYVAKFIARRFPEGLPEAMAVIIAEIVTDAFEDGCRWSDREAMRQDIMVAPRQVIINP